MNRLPERRISKARRPRPMLLLLDVGNTHTHVGLADEQRVRRRADLPTAGWFDGSAERRLRRFVARTPLAGAALGSVVPRATPRIRRALRRAWGLKAFELKARTLTGLRLDYPRPNSLGADRLANALAARHAWGAPVVVLDFGTALTFDVVDRRGCYVGGIIAPGLAAMTDYLHEKTALLPRIRLRDTSKIIGGCTEEAMRIGALHGYRALVRGLLAELRLALRAPRLPVVATGGCAALLAHKLPEVTAVRPELTLEGLRLAWAGARLGLKAPKAV